MKELRRGGEGRGGGERERERELERGKSSLILCRPPSILSSSSGSALL